MLVCRARKREKAIELTAMGPLCARPIQFFRIFPLTADLRAHPKGKFIPDRLYRERYSRVLRKRTSVDPKKTTCMLYLQADHTFYDHYKSEVASIEVMTRHVQRVDFIYRYTGKMSKRQLTGYVSIETRIHCGIGR